MANGRQGGGFGPNPFEGMGGGQGGGASQMAAVIAQMLASLGQGQYQSPGGVPQRQQAPPRVQANIQLGNDPAQTNTPAQK